MSITIMRGIAIVIQLIQGYFLYRTLSCLMEPRRNLIIRLLGWFATTNLAILIIYPQDPVNITLGLVGFLLINTLVFRGRWLVKISVIMIFYPIIMALNFLSLDIGGIMYFNIAEQSEAANTFWSAMRELIPLAFWFGAWKLLKCRLIKIRELLDTKSWLFLDLINMASMAAVISCVYYTPDASYKVYPCMAACIVTNIGSIYLASYLADSIRKDMERKNLRLQQDYYEELEKNQLQIRRFRHDMNNHFAVLGKLLQEDDKSSALQYFSELSGYVEARNRQFCKNGIVNALLNVKYNEAVETGIDCFFNISIDGLMSLDDISLCTIFANTLDNAIEACEKIKEQGKKKLSVKARYTENGYFSYEVVNSKVNEIREKKGKILTDKEDSRSHGLGVASVREIVEKYDGTMDVAYTEDEFRVVMLIEC